MKSLVIRAYWREGLRLWGTNRIQTRRQLLLNNLRDLQRHMLIYLKIISWLQRKETISVHLLSYWSRTMKKMTSQSVACFPRILVFFRSKRTIEKKRDEGLQSKLPDHFWLLKIMAVEKQVRAKELHQGLQLKISHRTHSKRCILRS